MKPELVVVNGVKMGPFAFNSLLLHPVLNDLFDQLTSFDLTSCLGVSIRIRMQGALMRFNEQFGRAIFGYSPAAEAYCAATKWAVMTKEQVGFRPYSPGNDNPVCYAGLLVLVGDVTRSELAAELGLSDKAFGRMMAAPEKASERLLSDAHTFLLSRRCHLSVAEQRVEVLKSLWPGEVKELATSLEAILDWIRTIPPRYRKELGPGRLPVRSGRQSKGEATATTDFFTWDYLVTTIRTRPPDAAPGQGEALLPQTSRIAEAAPA